MSLESGRRKERKEGREGRGEGRRKGGWAGKLHFTAFRKEAKL